MIKTLLEGLLIATILTVACFIIVYVSTECYHTSKNPIASVAEKVLKNITGIDMEDCMEELTVTVHGEK